MPLVFVLGVPGTGKTAVCDELKRRGYLARDTDGDNFSGWRSTATGEDGPYHVGPEERDEAFNQEFEWITDVDKVAALVAEADAAGTTAFLFGSSSNEHEIWPFAKLVICLAVDDDTLRHRLTTRANNDYGKNDLELKWCLEWNAVVPSETARYGATIVDATPPIDVVADEVLRLSESL